MMRHKLSPLEFALTMVLVVGASIAAVTTVGGYWGAVIGIAAGVLCLELLSLRPRRRGWEPVAPEIRIAWGLLIATPFGLVAGLLAARAGLSDGDATCLFAPAGFFAAWLCPNIRWRWRW